LTISIPITSIGWNLIGTSYDCTIPAGLPEMAAIGYGWNIGNQVYTTIRKTSTIRLRANQGYFFNFSSPTTLVLTINSVQTNPVN
jgi:hypothetical protein